MSSSDMSFSLSTPVQENASRISEPCRICGYPPLGLMHGAAGHKFIPATADEDAARRLIQDSTLHHNYRYRQSIATGTWAVFGMEGYFADSWVEAANKLFPPQNPSKPTALFQDPNCAAHLSVRPFMQGQVSTVVVLSPAHQYAASVTRGLFRGLKIRDGAISIHEDLLQGYLAEAYNAGYQAAVDSAYAEAYLESHPEMAGVSQ